MVVGDLPTFYPMCGFFSTGSSRSGLSSVVGGRLRRPFACAPFSAPRLRLVAELRLHCRCTAFLLGFSDRLSCSNSPRSYNCIAVARHSLLGFGYRLSCSESPRGGATIALPLHGILCRALAIFFSHLGFGLNRGMFYAALTAKFYIVSDKDIYYQHIFQLYNGDYMYFSEHGLIAVKRQNNLSTATRR